MGRKQNPRRKKEKQEREKLKQIQREQKLREEKIKNTTDIILSSEELEIVLSWFWFKAKDDEGYFHELVDKDRRIYNKLISKYYHLLPEKTKHKN